MLRACYSGYLRSCACKGSSRNVVQRMLQECSHGRLEEMTRRGSGIVVSRQGSTGTCELIWFHLTSFDLTAMCLACVIDVHHFVFTLRQWTFSVPQEVSRDPNPHNRKQDKPSLSTHSIFSGRLLHYNDNPDAQSSVQPRHMRTLTLL